jgi:MFS family permease
MPAAVSRPRYQVTYFILAICISSFSLLQSVVSPILPLLARNLHTSQKSVTWALTAYLLASAVFTPILGRLGDAFGKRKMLVLVLSCLAFGSFLAAMAGSLIVLIVARSIQGAGGGMIALVYGIIRDEFPTEKVAGGVGFIAALLAVGGGVGVIVAGPVVDLLGYQWLFLIPGLIVSASAVATVFVVPESPVRRGNRVGWQAALFLSGWLVALLLAVSQAPVWGWLSMRFMALVSVAALLALLWVCSEQRSEAPLIDLRLVVAPTMRMLNVVAFFFGISLYAVFAFVPGFLQGPRGSGFGFAATIAQSGLIVLPMSVTSFVGGSLSSRLAERFRPRSVVAAGLLMGAIPFLLLAFANTRIWQVIVALVILGAANGLVFAGMANMVINAVPAYQTGVASGVNTNIRTIGGAVGTAVLATVLAMSYRVGGLPTRSGYAVAFSLLACSRVIAGAASVRILASATADESTVANPIAIPTFETALEPEV